MKRLLLGVVLLDFLALNAWAFAQHGYLGAWQLMTANAATITVLADVVIALGMVLAWMWQDARRRGTAVLPYVVVTLALGSVGPLVYLLLRPEEPAVGTVPVTRELARA